MGISFYIITVSDRGFKGEREDKTGRVLMDFIKKLGYSISGYTVVPDEKEAIKSAIIEGADKLKSDVVLTAGGTGLSPRDVTPDITKKLVEYEIPGIPEAMRHYGLKKTVRAVLSRGIAGVRKSSIIINLPGSPGGARESLEAIIDALPHAVEKLRGSEEECGST